LTDVAIKAAKAEAKLRKLSDGGGLQLWLDPRGYRHWRFAYRFDAKQKVLALGTYPASACQRPGLRETTQGRSCAMAAIRRPSVASISSPAR